MKPELEIIEFECIEALRALTLENRKLLEKRKAVIDKVRTAQLDPDGIKEAARVLEHDNPYALDEKTAHVKEILERYSKIKLARNMQRGTRPAQDAAREITP